MRTELALVAAALLACGGDETTRPVPSDAGRVEQDASKPADAGKRDAGSDAGTEPSELVDSGHDAGATGGAMAVGGSGGEPNPPPKGGAGAGGQGGQPAPQETVLWSYEMTVEIDQPIGYGAMTGDSLAMRIETDKFGCTVGDEPQASGTTKVIEMDAACLNEFDEPLQVAVLFYRADGEAAGLVKRDAVSTWHAAVDGKTVIGLRRTQTWNLDMLCDAEAKCWNLGSFSGKWEAVGY
jgi:hypothetical protein